MAIIKKKIENLKPGKNYIISVRTKNPDLNVFSESSNSILVNIPKDTTVPNDIQNLNLYASFEKVMFTFDYSTDPDISNYEYQLYDNGAGTGNPVSQGFNSANVFTVSVTNSTDTTTKTYWGRVRGIDTSGNAGAWTTIRQTDQSTPLISSQYIDSLTASKITAGIIGAQTITLSGANSILKSNNYAAANTTFGGTGWKISGDGKAVFNDASIRSSLDIGEDQGTSDATSFHVDANGNMWSGSNSTSFSTAPFRVTNTGDVTANSLTLTGRTSLDNNGNASIFLTNNIDGIGLYNNTGTPFYVDSNDQFSLGNKLTWDGSSLTVSGNINITGGNTLTLINDAQADADIAYNTAISAQGVAITAQDTADTAAYVASTKITAGEAAFDINNNSTTISGNKIRTGSITAENNSSTINLNDGTFSFGDGALGWDGSTLNVSGTLDNSGFIAYANGAVYSSSTIRSEGTIFAFNMQVTEPSLTYRAKSPPSAAGTTAKWQQIADGLEGGTVYRIVLDSSRREIKNNIQNINNALEKVNKLKPRTFTFNDKYYGELDPSTGQPWTKENREIRELAINYGFVVEEVEEVDPRLVIHGVLDESYPADQPGGLYDLSSLKPLMWKEQDIIALLTKAVQELSEKVKELEFRLNS